MCHIHARLSRHVEAISARPTLPTWECHSAGWVKIERTQRLRATTRMKVRENVDNAVFLTLRGFKLNCCSTHHIVRSMASAKSVIFPAQKHGWLTMVKQSKTLLRACSQAIRCGCAHERLYGINVKIAQSVCAYSRYVDPDGTE